MQGCKAYRLCSVAVLNELGKEWWIDMKNVQISEELFVAIMRYFMLEQVELLPQIKQGLEKKLDAMVMRELYTKYKTAPTEEEKKKARKEYLDRRGVPEIVDYFADFVISAILAGYDFGDKCERK